MTPLQNIDNHQTMVSGDDVSGSDIGGFSDQDG